MNKPLTMAFAAASLLATPILAADAGSDSATTVERQGKMNPTAGSGAPANQPPGAETSDRTPNKQTPTPETQVDRSKTGETSDRTPSHHKN